MYNSSLLGPALAMCSVTSYSLLTLFPGRALFKVDTVEKTVDDTDEEKDEARPFNVSIVEQEDDGSKDKNKSDANGDARE